AANHVADEALGMDIRDLRAGVAGEDRVADRVHQMRLAEPDAAVDEQRVIRGPGILADLHRRGAGKLIALAFDEAVERERGVQPAAEELRRTGLRLALRRRARRRHRAPSGPDLEADVARPAVLGPPAADLIETMGFDPVDHET